MKPHGATIWGHTEETCAAEDCEAGADIHGLCFDHDAAESDAIAEAIWELQEGR